MRFATLETLTLSPLPCWKHLSEEKWRQLVAGLVAEIESEAAARRQRTGRQVLGGLRHSWTAPLRPPQKAEKVASAIVPRGEQGGSAGALHHLSVVRSGFPRGHREAPGWKPDGAVSARELPASVAVRDSFFILRLLPRC